jgi:hypothetical protein
VCPIHPFLDLVKRDPGGTILEVSKLRGRRTFSKGNVGKGRRQE